MQTAVLDGFGAPRSTLPASGWSSGFNENDDLQMTTFGVSLGLGLLPWNGILPTPEIPNPFGKFYGNWCGLKNGGERAPIDKVDSCCMAHDICLGDGGRPFEVALCQCEFAKCLARAVWKCKSRRCLAAATDMFFFAALTCPFWAQS
jgi:hypothetical protein